MPDTDALTCEKCDKKQAVWGTDFGYAADGLPTTIPEGYTQGDMDESGKFYCNPCMREHGLEWCDVCDIIQESTTYIESSGDTACEPCLERTYVTCDNCEELVRRTWMVGDICESCSDYMEEEEGGYGNHDNIRGWHRNPTLIFLDTVKDSKAAMNGPPIYHMGMEIELERSIDYINDIIPEFPNLWASTDGSLGAGGVEIISHPGSLDAWNTGKVIDWEEWNRLIHKKVTKQTEFTSNGIHVHVSRTAFHKASGKRSAAHLYKFMMFIQRHENTIQYLANRSGHRSYCKWDGVGDVGTRLKEAKTQEPDTYLDRYRPINTNNADTVEVRIFNGRTDVAFIQRCYQFVASVVEFTRDRPARRGLDWQDYTKFVSKHNKDYPSLAKFLVGAEKTLLKLSKTAINKWNKEVIIELKNRKSIAIERERRIREVQSSIGDCECEYCTYERESDA